MTTKTFTCERHPEVVLTVDASTAVESCAPCLFLLERDVDGMTGDERADELRDWLTLRMTVPFAVIHERIERLVGRPVYTHEMGLSLDRLMQEARGDRPPASNEEILTELRETGIPVIAIQVDGQAT